jgi:hypothetical protein
VARLRYSSAPKKSSLESRLTNLQLIEGIISDLAAERRQDFHVVRLNGFIHTDDKLAVKEIWRQLGKEMEVDDDLINIVSRTCLDCIVLPADQNRTTTRTR